MPKLSNMVGETGTIEIPVPNDEPLIVSYRRGVLTPRRQRRLLEAQQAVSVEGNISTSVPSVLCEVFCLLVAGWNLTDDSGQAIPITEDAVSDVETATLSLVIERITAAMKPDPTKDEPSNSGSSQTASSEPRRIGMAS